MNSARLGGLTGLAVVLFVSLFATGGIGAFDFWWWLGFNATLLVVLSLVLDPAYVPALRADLASGLARKVLIGLASAAVLYGVFWIGDQVSRAWFGAWAGHGIDSVYDLKHGAGPTRVLLLIALFIGPAEEIFWRGLLQRNLATRYGRWPGLVLATALYGGVHLASGNPMLVLAAVLCGVFWGWMYLRFGSVAMNVVSHTAWDLAVFVIWPLGAGGGV